MKVFEDCQETFFKKFLDRGLGRSPKVLKEKNMQTYDILIVGAGCAGLTAAVYAARAGKRVAVFESTSVGGQIATSPLVENYPGIASISGLDFSMNLLEQAQSFGAELVPANVYGLRADGDLRILDTDDGEYAAPAVILATGAKHRPLGLAREAEMVGRGVSYCATCDGAFFRGKTVAVVGGGSAALISAQALSGLAKQVYLIHRRDEFRGEAALAARLAAIENVTFLLGRNVTGLVGDARLTAVTLDDGSTLALDGLFIAVGQQASNEAFASAVALDERGYIVAGEDCRTTMPGVYAAGDCRTKAVRQLTTAAADGTVCAMAICGA